MEDFIKFNNLFSLYSSLLTETQREIFEDYYGENLSLQEIADNRGTSKSFVGKTIKECEQKLLDYENKLHKLEIKEIIDKCLSDDNLENIKKHIEKMSNLL